MKCKILSLVLVFLGVASAILVSCINEKSAESNILDVIPDNSSLVLSTSDIDSLSSLVSNGNVLVGMLYSHKSELKLPICQVVDSMKKAGVFGNHLRGEAMVSVRKDGNSGLCQL